MKPYRITDKTGSLHVIMATSEDKIVDDYLKMLYHD